MTEMYYIRVFNFNLGSPIKIGIFESLEAIENIMPQISQYGQNLKIIEMGIDKAQTNTICLTKMEINQVY